MTGRSWSTRCAALTWGGERGSNSNVLDRERMSCVLRTDRDRTRNRSFETNTTSEGGGRLDERETEEERKLKKTRANSLL
jgi:hypothetical protein